MELGLTFFVERWYDILLSLL